MTTAPIQPVGELEMELYQNPECRPGEGTVEPFTDQERAAIASYNGRMHGVIDAIQCADSVDTFRAAFDCLRIWYEALDSLHSELAEYPLDGPRGLRHSNAALRMLEHQALTLINHADMIRIQVCRHHVGASGPSLTGDSLAMSSGYIIVHGPPA